MTTIKRRVMNTDTLIDLNSKAQRYGFNQYLHKQFISKLDPYGVHVVSMSLPHQEDHLRLVMLLKVNGSDYPREGLLDITWEDFNNLAEVERTYA